MGRGESNHITSPFKPRSRTEREQLPRTTVDLGDGYVVDLFDFGTGVSYTLFRDGEKIMHNMVGEVIKEVFGGDSAVRSANIAIKRARRAKKRDQAGKKLKSMSDYI